MMLQQQQGKQPSPDSSQFTLPPASSDGIVVLALFPLSLSSAPISVLRPFRLKEETLWHTCSPAELLLPAAQQQRRRFQEELRLLRRTRTFQLRLQQRQGSWAPPPQTRGSRGGPARGTFMPAVVYQTGCSSVCVLCSGVSAARPCRARPVCSEENQEPALILILIRLQQQSCTQRKTEALHVQLKPIQTEKLPSSQSVCVCMC